MKKKEVKDKSRARKLERLKSHPQIARLKKEKKLTKERHLYEKEYGEEKTAMHRIVKESLKILLFTSIISAVGGFSLEWVKEGFIAVIPLVILLPVINDMVGSFGTVISSRFTTMLHEGYVRHKWWHNINLRTLIIQMFMVATLTAIIAFFMSIGISALSGNPYPLASALKILFIVLVDMLSLVGVVIIVAISLGLYFYDKKEDPNNFLIPITTAVADFGNMVILALLVVILF